MARPVEIDRAAAFEAGHGLFWERGGTPRSRTCSRPWTSRAAPSTPPSAASAHLDEAVLARYAERTERLLARIDGGRGLEALRFLTRTIVAASTTDRRRAVRECRGRTRAVDRELYDWAVAGLDGLRAAIDRHAPRRPRARCAATSRSASRHRWTLP